MDTNKPVLILDVDGVLLKWESNLPFFALDHGIKIKGVLKNYSRATHISFNELFGIKNTPIAQQLMTKYNTSAYGRHLSAFDDAIESVYKLKKKYKLVILTSFGDTIEHYTNRCKNLQAFYPDLFAEIICISYDKPKSTMLKDISITHGKIAGFVDDQLHNVDDVRHYAEKIGFDTLANNCIHMNHYDETAQYSNMIEVVDYFLNNV